MKTQNIYLTAVLLLAGISCRTKERAYTEWESRSGAGEYSSVLLQSYDSLDRFWLFQTDSTFYYRPGKGLYGYSGSLFIAETEVSHQGAEETSLHERYAENVHFEENYKAKPISKMKYVSILALMFIMVIVVWVGRSVRHWRN